MGYVWYLPYMWLRQRGPELRPQFRVASGHFLKWLELLDHLKLLVWKNWIDEM